MSNLSELLPAGAGAKSAEFVASGTLGSGVTVALQSDGTVTAISSATSSGVIYESADSTYNRVAYDSTNNKIVIAYQDEGNSQYLTSVVGTIASGAITFGTPVIIISSAGLGYDALTFNSFSGKVVYSFSPASNSYYGTAIVGTVSGTSISWGTPSIFVSATTADITSTYDSSAQKVLIFYRGSSNYGYGITTAISGTSISFGGQSTFNSAVTTNIQAAYNSTQNKTALIYKDAGNSNYGRSIVATVSGTSLSYGTSVALTTDTFSATRGDAAIVYDSSKDKIVASWESSTGAGLGAIGTISGTSISWGSAVTIKASNSADQTLIYDSVQNIVYSQIKDSIFPLTISGTSFTVGAETNLPTNNLQFIGAAFDVNAEVLAYAYRDNNNSSYGTSVLYNPNAATSASFIGITDQAIADTATGAVIVQGGVSDKAIGPAFISAGTPVVFEAANTIYTATAYDSTNNRIVVAYRDNGNSGYGTAVVGTVSGSTISFGTPVVFRSETCNRNSIVFDSNSNKVVISFQRALTNFYYGLAIVGTVSGTSISFGTAATFITATPDFISSTFDSSNNKVVISWQNSGNSGYGTAIVGTVSGTSISFGSPVVFESSNTQLISSTFDSSNNKVAIAYSDVGNSNYGTAVVGTVSGTSISFGSPVIFLAYSAQGAVAITYDSNAQKTVVIYQDSNNGYYGTAKVGTVSGTSISFGSGVVFGQINTEYSAVFDSNNNKVVVAYQDASNSSYGTVVLGSVSGTDITFGTPVVFEAAQSRYISTAFDSTENKVVVSYEDVGNSNNGTAVVTDIARSLTPNTDYYVQSDGSLSTTVSTVPAGRALSSTSILLEG